MKIVVVGTRGIPDIMGGVETHCENIYPLLVDLECEVIVVRRACYVDSDTPMTKYKGVHLKDISTPKHKSIEALAHTFSAILYAKKQKADIVHIHAIGPSIFSPLAKMLGMKVVVTHHSQNYHHNKWGRFAKLMLKKGEKNAVKHAHHIIFISQNIKDQIKVKYARENDVSLIYNGVNESIKIEAENYIQSIGLEAGKYIFTLGRFVEDKGFHDLIDAYQKASLDENIKLVIAGDADHETAYSISLKKRAGEAGVILTGFVKGEQLAELFTHTGLFVLPSFFEGLPISVLEAMSYDLPLFASDIPANRDIDLAEEVYFPPGDIDVLSEKITTYFKHPVATPSYDMSKYNWNTIAEQTLDVYKNVLDK